MGSVAENVNRPAQLTRPICLREGPVANEAYVSGTFDNWKKTVRLEQKGGVFEKTVGLPLNERILYKAS